MKHVDILDFAPDFERAVAFFKAQQSYAVSPLRRLLAPEGQSFWAKDETGRMGLGAFKALGASYAVARLLGDTWFNQTGETLTPARLLDADVRALAVTQTFV